MSSVRDTVSPTVNAGTSGSLGLSGTGSLQPEKNIAQNNVSNNILSRIAEESGLYEFEFITEIERTTDTGCPVRSIGLKFTCIKRILKCTAI
jgi:hypothetical protein